MILKIQKVLISILKYILIIWICFLPPIAVHEIGHFITAKATNIGTTEISLGFGPGISTIINEDKYSLRLLPLGGFVKLDNENNEVYHKEHLLTLLMGPLSNLALAYLCFLIYYSGLFNYMILYKNSSHSIIFKFKNNFLFRYLKEDMFESNLNKEDGIKTSEALELNYDLLRHSTTKSITKGAWFAFKKINLFSHKDKYFKDLSRIFFLKEINSSKENKTSGPIGIIHDAVDHINRSLLSLIYFIGEISLSVGILNLLPIYPLDGGKIWPIILKLKDSSQVVQSTPDLNYWQLLGIAICLGFFTYIFLRDIGISIKKIYTYWRKK